MSTFLQSWSGVISSYLLVVALVTFPGLGSTGLMMMEGMTVDTAERMLESGDFLVPELYGEIYTYKPPLVYWLTALSIHLFGATAWAVRLPGAVASVFLGLGVLLLIGRATRPRVGLFAALAATTGVLWVQKVKLGEFDTVLASAVGVAVAAAAYNLVVERARSSPWIWLLAYLALAAGFLAKGTPAIMAFAPGLLGAVVLSRQSRRLFSPGHLLGASVFLMVVGTYLVLLWSAAGPAAFEQPLDEAHRRGFEWTLEALGRTLPKPLIIAGAFLPWSLAWPWASRSSGDSLRRLQRVAWGFLGLGILIFMAVPTHETRYYLPLSVPAALVAAVALERLTEPSRKTTRFFHGVGLCFGLFTIVLAWMPVVSGELRVLLTVVGFGMLGTVQWLRHHRPRQQVASILLAAALCVWMAETWALRPHRASTRVLDSVAQKLDPWLPEDTTIWAVGEADHVGKNGSLLFYLDRPVQTIRPTDPLPPSGSYVLLSARDFVRLPQLTLREIVHLVDGLELIQRFPHPRGPFLLYRVREKEAGLGDGVP